MIGLDRCLVERSFVQALELHTVNLKDSISYDVIYSVGSALIRRNKSRLSDAFP